MAEVIPHMFKIDILQIEKIKKHKFQVMAITISNDRRYIVFATKWSGPSLSGEQPRLHLFDLFDLKQLWQIDFPDNFVNSLAITPNNHQIIISSIDATRFLDMADGKEISALTQEDRCFSSIAFSSDGQYVLCNSTTNTSNDVYYLELKDWREVGRFVGHTKSIYDLAFMPDEKQIITCGSDKTIRLWDITTARELQRFNGHTKDIYTIAVSNDGSQILSGSVDKTIKLWDVLTGKEIKTLVGHANTIRMVQFSPDRSLALSGANDKTLRLWDINAGKLSTGFDYHEQFVSIAAFSLNGMFIISADYAGRIVIGHL